MVDFNVNYREVHLKASVCLRETRCGGRLYPAANHYSPNIKIQGVDAYSRFNLGVGNCLDLGVVASVELTLVVRQEFLSLLFEGQKFQILEGHKNVGEGIIECIHYIE